MLSDAIARALKRKQENGWDKLYLAVDLHGVVLECSYNNDINIIYECKDILKQFTDSEHICLIAYTSSWNDSIYSMLEELYTDSMINFDYINHNPEVKDNDLSCFNQKFYFDLLLDDKAGFVPETDWYILYQGLKGIL